jgi:hypothetical protein
LALLCVPSFLFATLRARLSLQILIWCQSSNFPNYAPYETGPEGSFLKSPQKTMCSESY